MNEIVKLGSQQLQQAIDLVVSLGKRDGAQRSSAIVDIIDEIKDADEDAALFLARLASEGVAFNDFVMKSVQGLEIGNVYQDITAKFASIRKDAKEAIENVTDDGEEGFLDKLKAFWNSSTKGTVADRFKDIIELYDGVNNGLSAQVKSERKAVEAFKIFRLAQGQGVVVALGFKKKHEALLEEAKAAAAKAQSDIDAAAGLDEIERAKLKNVRDAAVDYQRRRENAWQTAKDIAEDISNGHNVSDMIVKDAEGAIDLKDRVFKRGVSLLGNHQATVAAFALNYAAKIGLADGVNALDAMTKGMNDSLNDLADLSGKVNERAIKSAYGTTVDPDAVDRFARAMLEEAETSISLIEQSRGEAAASSEKIADSVENLRKRFVEMSTKTRV